MTSDELNKLVEAAIKAKRLLSTEVTPKLYSRNTVQQHLQAIDAEIKELDNEFANREMSHNRILENHQQNKQEKEGKLRELKAATSLKNHHPTDYERAKRALETNISIITVTENKATSEYYAAIEKINSHLDALKSQRVSLESEYKKLDADFEEATQKYNEAKEEYTETFTNLYLNSDQVTEKNKTAATAEFLADQHIFDNMAGYDEKSIEKVTREINHIFNTQFTYQAYDIAQPAGFFGVKQIDRAKSVEQQVNQHVNNLITQIRSLDSQHSADLISAATKGNISGSLKELAVIKQNNPNSEIYQTVLQLTSICGGKDNSSSHDFFEKIAIGSNSGPASIGKMAVAAVDDIVSDQTKSKDYS